MKVSGNSKIVQDMHSKLRETQGLIQEAEAEYNERYKEVQDLTSSYTKAESFITYSKKKRSEIDSLRKSEKKIKEELALLLERVS